MEWFVVVVFLVFITGLGIVTRAAISHARRSSSPSKAVKSTRSQKNDLVKGCTEANEEASAVILDRHALARNSSPFGFI